MSHSRGGAWFRQARGGDRDMECTPECASPAHAGVILTSVALGNLRLLQHCYNLCSNAWRISDGFGRSPLHVAASRGHTHITEWLVARKKVAVDTVDKESGWSALHRSVYFGELGTAVSLVKVSFFLPFLTLCFYTLFLFCPCPMLSLPHSSSKFTSCL